MLYDFYNLSVQRANSKFFIVPFEHKCIVHAYSLKEARPRGYSKC
jgi:hypothetical protein